MKILLVEDSRATALITTARLEHFGHEVTHAISGKVAIQLFQPNKFDLILMDIEMPEMNGFETTTRIRALEGNEDWSWTPIIFLTATDTASNLVTAIKAGGDDFLSKMTDESVLQAKMEAMGRIAVMRHRLSIANQKLQEQAHKDVLTGIANRRYLDMQTDVQWERCLNDKKPFTLLLMDVDKFKQYNDTYGHQKGDFCLQHVASIIDQVSDDLKLSRKIDNALAARYGGEEFVLILPGATSEIGQNISKIILEKLKEKPWKHEKNDWGYVSVSIGCKTSNPSIDGLDIAATYREADELLYKAKEGGRNQFQFN